MLELNLVVYDMDTLVLNICYAYVKVNQSFKRARTGCSFLREQWPPLKSWCAGDIKTLCCDSNVMCMLYPKDVGW